MIAVMSEGTLQQLDTPDNIYNRPRNRFVAEFVGSPPMNFIELASGEVSALSGSLRGYLDGVGVGNCRGSVGIRPESLRIGAPSSGTTPVTAYSGQAMVTGIMPTGGSWIIELTVMAQKLFATVNTPPYIELGDETAFWVDRADLHLFDETGNRLSDDELVSERLEET
jgi:iron(III) transport system ATP-binding protein